MTAPIAHQYDETDFTRGLRDTVNGRWFPAFDQLRDIHADHGYQGVIRWCVEAQTAGTSNNLFGPAWDAHRKTVEDVRLWAERDGVTHPMFPTLVMLGQQVKLVYPPQFSDERVVEATVVIASDSSGDFDVEMSNGDSWTVLGSEQRRGEVFVRVQS